MYKVNLNGLPCTARGVYNEQTRFRRDDGGNSIPITGVFTIKTTATKGRELTDYKAIKKTVPSVEHASLAFERHREEHLRGIHVTSGLSLIRER